MTITVTIAPPLSMPYTARMNQVDWQQLLQQGIDAFHEGQDPLAIRLLQQVIEQQPSSRDARYWQANALRRNGEMKAAERQFRGLLEQQPGDFKVTMALAFLLRDQARLGPAEDLLKAACSQAFISRDEQLQAVGFLHEINRFESARGILLKVIAESPQDARLYFRLARLSQGLGDFDTASEALRKTLELDPNIGGAWLSLAHTHRYQSADDADWQFIRQAASDRLGDEARMCLAFARGKVLDDLQQYAEAWQQFEAGNQLRIEQQPWSRTSWEQQVDATVSRPARSPAASSSRRRPLFIIGMLRSGTTLLEQLLAGHPQVTARGELNFLSRLAAGQMNGDALWQHLQAGGPDGHWYVDKNPLNFRFLDALAAGLPEARVIHMLRDGRDSCFSCYTQLFQHPDAGFSNDLDDLLDYYRQYQRLMAHFTPAWGEQLLTVRYEDLVNDTTHEMDRVLNFLDLGSDPPMSVPPETARPIRTASSWQARQAVHQRSVGRWRNYSGFAPEFFAQVAAAQEQAGSE